MYSNDALSIPKSSLTLAASRMRAGRRTEDAVARRRDERDDRRRVDDRLDGDDALKRAVVDQHGLRLGAHAQHDRPSVAARRRGDRVLARDAPRPRAVAAPAQRHDAANRAFALARLVDRRARKPAVRGRRNLGNERRQTTGAGRAAPRPPRSSESPGCGARIRANAPPGRRHDHQPRPTISASAGARRTRADARARSRRPAIAARLGASSASFPVSTAVTRRNSSDGKRSSTQSATRSIDSTARSRHQIAHATTTAATIGQDKQSVPHAD